MRSYTIAAPGGKAIAAILGHNAIVRIAPFATHCQLRCLRTARWSRATLLSHDQIEAC